MAGPRKYPSGAQKRKARKERNAATSAAYSPSGGGSPGAVDLNRDRDLGGDGIEWTSSGPAVELPLYGVAPVVLAKQVNAVIAQLEQGMFIGAAYLVDGMMRDDRIRATMDVRTGGLLGSRLDLEPSADNSRARAAKEDCEKSITRILPLSQIEQIMNYGLLLGVGIAQRITDKSRDYATTIRAWNPRFLRFDWATRRYRIVTMNRGEIAIEPDDPEWVVYEPFGPHAWMRSSLMRCLATPWLTRHWVRVWWSRHQEVHGKPMILGIVPPDKAPQDTSRFIKELSRLGHDSAIRLMQGADGNRYDVKLLEATANTWQGFRELLTHADDSIAITILGQRSSTSGSTGLGSDANPGHEVRIDLKRRDALIGDALRDQVLRPWAAEQYGDPELAPYLKWNVDPPEDLQAKANALSLLGDAVGKLAPYGADARVLLESFGVELVDEAEAPPDVPGTPDPKSESEDETESPDDTAMTADDSVGET